MWNENTKLLEEARKKDLEQKEHIKNYHRHVACIYYRAMQKIEEQKCMMRNPRAKVVYMV